jgi:hypothetical protein
MPASGMSCVPLSAVERAFGRDFWPDGDTTDGDSEMKRASIGCRAIVLAVLAASLAGCVSLNEATPVTAQDPAPSSMKSQIVSGASDVRNDPSSIRNAEISWVVQDPNGSERLICVRAQRRDASGQWDQKVRLISFSKAGFILRGSWNSPFCANPSLRWQPFPELQAAGR